MHWEYLRIDVLHHKPLSSQKPHPHPFPTHLQIPVPPYSYPLYQCSVSVMLRKTKDVGEAKINDTLLVLLIECSGTLSSQHPSMLRPKTWWISWAAEMPNLLLQREKFKPYWQEKANVERPALHNQVCCGWRPGVARAVYRENAESSASVTIRVSVLWHRLAHFVRLLPSVQRWGCIYFGFWVQHRFSRPCWRMLPDSWRLQRTILGLVWNFWLPLAPSSCFIRSPHLKVIWSRDGLSVPLCYLALVTWLALWLSRWLGLSKRFAKPVGACSAA